MPYITLCQYCSYQAISQVGHAGKTLPGHSHKRWMVYVCTVHRNHFYQLNPTDQLTLMKNANPIVRKISNGNEFLVNYY